METYNTSILQKTIHMKIKLIASAFALIAFNATKFVFIYVKFGIQPFEWATLKVLVIGSVTLFVNTLLVEIDNMLFDILFRSSIVTIVYSSLIIGWRTSADANGIFDGIKRRVRKGSQRD